jgi:hypothetical protein
MKVFTKFLRHISGLLMIMMVSIGPVIANVNNVKDDSSAGDLEETGFLQNGDYYLEDIKLFPNPCTSYINLSLETGFMVDRIAISDMLGNLVWEQRNFEEHLQFRVQIPVHELKNGIYFMEIESGNQRVTRKISKE